MILLLAASSSDWTPTVLPIIGVVIGAAIGAVAAVGGGAFAQWFTRQLERQSLAAALAGEVEAVKAIVEFRRYRQLIQSFIDQTRAPPTKSSISGS